MHGMLMNASEKENLGLQIPHVHIRFPPRGTFSATRESERYVKKARNCGFNFNF